MTEMKKLQGLKKKELEAVKEFCAGVKETLGRELIDWETWRFYGQEKTS